MIQFSAACPCCGRPSTWTATQVQQPVRDHRVYAPTSHVTDITHEETP